MPGPGLPGSNIHPAPKTEIEALHQIVQALFHLGQNVANLQVELRQINTSLQHISQRIPNR